MFSTSSISLRLPIYLFLSHIFPLLSRACSQTTFPQIYNPYPDCAAQCLACPDADYVDNFAHNCDYAAGDCCRSKYHSAIAASWECVQTSCEGIAQQAFDMFVQYCQSVGVPLAQADVPVGYALDGGGAGAGNGTGNGGELTPVAPVAI
jgi:hypothetical protein